MPLARALFREWRGTIIDAGAAMDGHRHAGVLVLQPPRLHHGGGAQDVIKRRQPETLPGAQDAG